MKKKSKAVNPLVYINSLYNSENLVENAKASSLALYSVILLFILALINLVKAATGVSITGIVQSFLGTLIALPIILAIVYVIFYIFIVALEKKNQTFLQSYLAFLALALPYFIIGHVLNWIRGTTYNDVIQVLVSLLILIMMIYFVVMFVRSFSKYFKTSGYKVLASGLMSFIFIGVLSITYYLSLLISNLV